MESYTHGCFEEFLDNTINTIWKGCKFFNRLGPYENLLVF